MLKRQEDKIDPIRSKFGEVERDEIDMEKKMAYVEAYLHEHKRFSFMALLELEKSRMEIIVTFLVILELMKIGRITIRQNDFKNDIIISRYSAPK
jgi:segregation and condensation protein A